VDGVGQPPAKYLIGFPDLRSISAAALSITRLRLAFSSSVIIHLLLFRPNVAG